MPKNGANLGESSFSVMLILAEQMPKLVLDSSSFLGLTSSCS